MPARPPSVAICLALFVFIGTKVLGTPTGAQGGGECGRDDLRIGLVSRKTSPRTIDAALSPPSPATQIALGPTMTAP